MTKSNRLIRIVVCGWLLLTLVALAAMYRLWWTRERALYAGQPPDAQRTAVIARAGLPMETLPIASRIDAEWPSDTSYSASGSEVTLSYVKYLILPRVPSGSATFIIKDDAGEYTVSGAENPRDQGASYKTDRAAPHGLFLSVFIIWGMAAGNFSRMFRLNVPEGMALTSLVLATCAVIIKYVGVNFSPVGWLMSACGVFGGMVVLLNTIRARRCETKIKTDTPRRSQPCILLYFSFAIIVGATVWCLLMSVVVVPNAWDAWAQWGPKAKILALPETRLSDVQYFVPGSGDYPLLWPSVWAFSGWLAGGWEEQWSKGWGAVFMALTIWQLVSFTAIVAGSKRAGWMAGALFVSMPAVPLVASWGYAEAPFWLMSMCAMTRLMHWRASKLRADLWWAAVFLAAAACTKNEGILLAVLSAVWVFVCSFNFRQALMTLLPTAVLAGSWKLYCIFVLQVSNHAVPQLDSLPLGIGSFLERVWLAGGYIARQWIDVRQWNIVLPGVVILFIWLLARGGMKNRINLFLPLAMLFGLLATILLYGENWLWQLGVAWNRLTIQFLVVSFPVLIVGVYSRNGNIHERVCLNAQSHK